MGEYLEYLRKSREDLEYEKTNAEYKTLERHKKRLKVIAEEANKAVKDENIFEEVVSGDSIESRPVIQTILKKIEDPNILGVWVIDIQRLTRGDLGDQNTIIKTFKYTNTLILTPEKEYNLNDPADEEYLIDKLSYSRKEYNGIKKRLAEGRLDSVREGKFISSIPPYGYTRYKLKGQKGWSLKIDEEQAKIVKLIFKLCIDGKGTFEIASYLNKLGIKTAKNSIWRKNGIREMLHNETYCGFVKWQERHKINYIENGTIKKKTIRSKKGQYILSKGLHEPIISKEDFDLTQSILKNNSVKYVKTNKELLNPFAGIIRCECCNKVLARGPERYNTYYSKNIKKKYLMKAFLFCTSKCVVSSTIEKIESLLIENLKMYLSEYERILHEYKSNESSIINDTNNKLDILNSEIEKENKKLNRLRDFLEEGIYDKETFLQRSTIIKNNIDKLKANKNKIENESEEIKFKKIELFIPKLNECINIYDQLSIADKNKILKSIIEKIIYHKTNFGKENDLRLDVFLKI